MIKEIGNEVPVHIKKKIDKLYDEAAAILNKAYSFIEGFDLQISLVFEHSAPSNILTDEERFQQVCFITRYECLPNIEGIIVREKDGKYYFSNLDFIRYVLNEYRIILFNQRDSIFYKKLHNFCYSKLANNDASKGLSISAFDVNNSEKTDEFIRFLNANTKAIDFILTYCELDYIYNGILQHADNRHTERYWDDYYNGELNYIFLKNAILVSETKNFMDVYYKIMNCLTFPKLGSS